MEKGARLGFLPTKNKKCRGASSDLPRQFGKSTTVNRNSRQAFFCISTAYMRNIAWILLHIYAVYPL